mgnify:CR=1 FL=1
MKRALLLLTSLLLLAATPALAQKRYKKKHILKDLKTLDGFKSSFVGFVLYDPENNNTLACQYDIKYMTPASNTKLYTFYAGTKLLGKAVPAMQYQIKGDSLIFWGTGNPLFLHHDLNDPAALEFLSARKEKLYYWPRPTEDARFGPGWSWDDFNGYYSAEKSAFPIYGNSLNAYLNHSEQSLQVAPAYFQSHFARMEASDPPSRSRVYREEALNQYRYFIGEATDGEEAENDTLVRPFLYSDALYTELLADTLHKPVYLYQGSPETTEAKTLYSIPTDTLYKHMLQPSDNLFAEQILMMASGLTNDTLSTRATIDYMQAKVFADWQDEPVWVAGTGLSLYYKITQLGMIKMLRIIREDVGVERLFELLPAGGMTGTISNWYGAKDGPYVFAKTGTLSNNHSLTGYLKADSGKTLLFCIMVNHYAHSTSKVRESMGEILKKIKKAY